MKTFLVSSLIAVSCSVGLTLTLNLDSGAAVIVGMACGFLSYLLVSFVVED
jgi:hypothetical protein